MNVTFNTDTVAFLVHEIDDMLCNADISSGTLDDLSNFLNALMNIHQSDSIVIVKNNDNIDDDWDEDGPDDDGPDLPAPIGLSESSKDRLMKLATIIEA